MVRRTKAFAHMLALVACPLAAQAGEADVVGAKAQQAADGTWRFDVTVKHDDAGWEHYANQWDILDTDGNVLATRVLLHPHDNEQPFTRSLSGVRVPDGLSHVIVRAKDLVHGEGGATVKVAIDAGS